ncbi:MAG: ROK family protein [Deltaproteobacteria bacterium]|nr:ROK family protein [Deltaproteobacteria bacterium]MBI4224485.1 ROK family protein [Deltaproteobacteria bacterium]
MRVAVAVDVGGTHLRVGLVNESGQIVRKEKKEVGANRRPKDFFQRMAGLIRETAGEKIKEIAGIGLGLPGICNFKEGVVHQLPHFPEWRDVPAARLLAEDFSCPIVFDNDANMAAVGEYWKGSAKGLNNFMMLTLGTGIGGGIFLDGKIWRGDEGFAGEVGHMTIEADGRSCACGSRGCWETYAASQAVPKGTTAETLAKAADGGDSKALAFWREYGIYLGIGIGNLAKITGVENYCLGGSIAKAHPHFMESCREEIKKRTYPRLAQKVKVLPSALGEDGNLLGAASSVFHEVSASL